MVLQEDETLVETLHSLQNLILNFSHTNHITGVFYYANLSFYHCIEGESDVVERLLFALNKLNKLGSITHINTIDDLNESLYSEWSMRYVKKESVIFGFFKERNIFRFTPLCLSKKDQKKLVDVIATQFTIAKKKTYKRGYKVRNLIL